MTRLILAALVVVALLYAARRRPVYWTSDPLSEPWGDA